MIQTGTAAQQLTFRRHTPTNLRWASSGCSSTWFATGRIRAYSSNPSTWVAAMLHLHIMRGPLGAQAGAAESMLCCRPPSCCEAQLRRSLLWPHFDPIRCLEPGSSCLQRVFTTCETSRSTQRLICEIVVVSALPCLGSAKVGDAEVLRQSRVDQLLHRLPVMQCSNFSSIPTNWSATRCRTHASPRQIWTNNHHSQQPDACSAC